MQLIVQGTLIVAAQLTLLEQGMLQAALDAMTTVTQGQGEGEEQSETSRNTHVYVYIYVCVCVCSMPVRVHLGYVLLYIAALYCSFARVLLCTLLLLGMELSVC